MLNTLPYEYEQDGGEGRTAWRGPVEGVRSMGETHRLSLQQASTCLSSEEKLRP